MLSLTFDYATHTAQFKTARMRIRKALSVLFRSQFTGADEIMLASWFVARL